MTIRTRGQRMRLAGIIAVTVGTLALVGVGAGTAAAADSPSGGTGGVGITVTTVPGTGSPTSTPSVTPSPTSTRPGASTTPSHAPSGGGGNGNTVVNPSTDTPPTPAPGEFDLGGVVYVSGLSSDYSPSANPFGGELQLHFTVRNVSSATFSSTARFWVDGPFGLVLGESDDVEIADLKPSEIRLVSATVHGVGQWTFVNAHATFMPPKDVAGVELSAVTRDSFVFFLPWLLLAIAVIGAAAFAVSRIVRELEAEGALVGKPA